MALRSVSLLVVLLVVPAFTQTYPMSPGAVPTGMNRQPLQRESELSQVNAAPATDPRVAQLQELRHDLGELWQTSTLVQFDLRQLQKGVLPKTLNDDLRKLEKLSKRVRSEMQ